MSTNPSSLLFRAPWNPSGTAPNRGLHGAGFPEGSASAAAPRNQEEGRDSDLNLYGGLLSLCLEVKPRLNLWPNNWLQKKGKWYHFLKTFKSWTNSQKSCLIMKSHLLMIQDKAELISSPGPG
ncbi:uncharacterized protein CLEC2D isoform X3 [Canis lupus familiaris]|uniref:uncharacterized protein CLEC2D isoform X3 n=1 Tax=Canis lupus familiaris TaxID=9615 RepID=UPI0018F6FE52|nr:uncharacterized protein CLEC2D isoform X3 [Canis lupus familiaris]XP_038315730.1 uncharacterized protein CLEC2D isoform X3 [Canis lupus familiaris]XP_038432682.1 uncharacterized protein CLEC2D isoform X3 [Canis lupus familiaris]